MKISKNMQKELNEQINAEMHSGYLYLSMSAYFEDSNLPGAGAWMKMQAGEELEHAMKLFDYVHGRGGKVELTELKAPKTEWDSPLDAFQDAYAHEQMITGMIHSLVDSSTKEKDHATTQMLQWFVEEQVEEEATAEGIVEQLKMVGDNPQAMLMLDSKLARRKQEE